LQPAELTLRFALFTAGGLRAVTLMTQVALIGTIKLFAAKAFAPGGTLHWANSKNLSCPSRKTPPQNPSMEEQAKKIQHLRTKRRKVCTKLRNKNHRAGIWFSNRWVYPIFRSAVTFALTTNVRTDAEC
jgi:hypothetical protein